MNCAKKNNQSVRSVLRKNLEDPDIRHVFGNCFSRALPIGRNYGACGMVTGSPNCLNNSGVVPLPAMFRSISMGLKALCMDVLMMVMANATFNLPLAVMLPKISFLSKTALRMACSAKLFVGEISGYFKKVKSSFLKVISRMRMLSDSWCDSGACRYSLRNCLRISFLPERYASTDKAEC